MHTCVEARECNSYKLIPGTEPAAQSECQITVGKGPSSLTLAQLLKELNIPIILSMAEFYAKLAEFAHRGRFEDAVKDQLARNDTFLSPKECKKKAKKKNKRSVDEQLDERLKQFKLILTEVYTHGIRLALLFIDCLSVCLRLFLWCVNLLNIFRKKQNKDAIKAKNDANKATLANFLTTVAAAHTKESLQAYEKKYYESVKANVETFENRLKDLFKKYNDVNGAACYISKVSWLALAYGNKLAEADFAYEVAIAAARRADSVFRNRFLGRTSILGSFKVSTKTLPVIFGLLVTPFALQTLHHQSFVYTLWMGVVLTLIVGLGCLFWKVFCNDGRLSKRYERCVYDEHFSCMVKDFARYKALLWLRLQLEDLINSIVIKDGGVNESLAYSMNSYIIGELKILKSRIESNRLIVAKLMGIQRKDAKGIWDALSQGDIDTVLDSVFSEDFVTAITEFIEACTQAFV